MRYWSGYATGVCSLALGLFAVFALYFIPEEVEMYRGFEAARLPTVTMVVISPVWRWAVPAVGLAAVLALSFAKIESEVRRSVGLAITAALALFAVVFTYWALYLPMFELSDKISAG